MSDKRNFEKFLVDFTHSGRDAHVVARYASKVDPFEIESRIVPLLAKVAHATDQDTNAVPPAREL
jgi:glutathione peroxidase-family protein